MTSGASAPLPGHRAAVLRADAPSIAGAARSLVLRAEGFEALIPAATGAIPVRPPGLRAGPLIAERDIVSVTRDQQFVPREERATFATLQRAPDGEGWELDAECRGVPPPGADDVLRVWLGPFGSPRAVVTVHADGRAADERATPPAPAPGVVVRREARAWRATIPIPASALEPGRLRFALERVDSRGLRTSWPRPMMPDQPEPGRAIADLTAWGGLGP